MTQMTAGVTTSVIGHAAILIVALAGLSAAKPLQPEVVDSIAVDLVPLADVTNIRQGTLDSKVVKTDTPALAESSKPAQLAQKTGNSDQDQVKPEETSKASPAPVENTAPKPVPVPVPTPVPPPPKPADPTPPPVVAPDPAPAPVVAQPQKEVVADTGSTPAVNVAPIPASKPAQLQKAPDKAPPDAVTQVTPPPKKTAVKPPPDDTKTDPSPQARTADKISDLLNAMDSRGATTGSGGSPTLGKPTGGAATLTQTMLDMLKGAVLKCFHVPQAALDEGASAVVEFHLTRDGMVDGDPAIISTTGATTGGMTGTAAVHAVLQCGQNGYKMLPANLYDGDNGWNAVLVTFNASDAVTSG